LGQLERPARVEGRMTDTGTSKSMGAEKELRRAKHDCLRWLKGFHNIQRSALFMERFAKEGSSQDHHAKEALFHAAIVSYAKPFTQTETGERKGRLSIKPLKRDPSFEVDTHEHIMELRHKLIAHDDFTAIEPKYVWISLTGGSGFSSIFAPFQAYLRNSCISYPQDEKDFGRMRAHIGAACNGAMRYLDQRVTETRQLMLTYPEEAQSVFQERPDSTLGIITGDGKTTEFKLDISVVETHPMIAVSTPHTPMSFGNYRHTTVNVRILFNGPQGVDFDGAPVNIVSG